MNPQTPEELYAGIGSLGVYKTTNGGDNWYLTNLAYSDVSAIHVDKESPGTIFTGQYGWAIMKTEDFGENWEHPEFDTAFDDTGAIILEPFRRVDNHTLDDGVVIPSNCIIYIYCDKPNALANEFEGLFIQPRPIFTDPTRRIGN